jgi:hypothetical protein
MAQPIRAPVCCRFIKVPRPLQGTDLETPPSRRRSQAPNLFLVLVETEFYTQPLSESLTIIPRPRPSHVRTKPRPSLGAELLRLSRKL